MDKLALFGGPPVRARLLPYAHHTIEADDIAAVSEALASDLITQGSAIVRFEKALAARGGARHAVAFTNGTAALHAACWAAGLGASDEAITTPLTFAATANAVVYQGAWPVFADIDAATLNLDPDAVKRAATPRTRAVLSVDFAGLPCEYDTSPACPVSTTGCCRSRASTAGPSSPTRRTPSAARTAAGPSARSPT